MPLSWIGKKSPLTGVEEDGRELGKGGGGSDKGGE